jgi:hypothetical protein
MHWMLILAIASYVAAVTSRDDLPVLSTIPVIRTTLKPRTYIKTHYALIEDNAVVQANMVFNTSRPSIHLDNFIQIIDINCDSGKIYLTFDTPPKASEAFTEWSSYPNLAVLVGHERKCNGKEVGTFEVSQMTLLQSKITIETSRSLKRSDVVTDWSMKVSHREVNLQKRGWFVDTKNKIASGARKGANAIYNTFNPSLDMKRSGAYDFDSNYNTTTNSSRVSRIVLFEFFQYSAYCVDCYTTGAAHTNIDIKGRLSKVISYNLTMTGEYFSNMNLRLVKGGWGENKIWSLILFKVALIQNVNIPGVLCLGNTHLTQSPSSA